MRREREPQRERERERSRRDQCSKCGAAEEKGVLGVRGRKENREEGGGALYGT
jgi:hypothetical protein